MSFSSVTRRVSERFNEVQVLLNHITSSEPADVTELVPLDVKIMKGLFYVHLYAAFEKSINEIIETALTLISSKSIKNNHLSPTLLSIALSDKFKSLKDSSHSKVLIKSSEIFSESISKNVVPINEAIFANHLQNAWVTTIIEITTILGIDGFSFGTRGRVTIDEVVDRRNAVAHGRDSASSVGERYRANILRQKLEIVSEATQMFLSVIEEHCDSKKYVKPNSRRYY
ncbi:MAG: hypothetical protein HQM10_15220 [Candidatus Riflebacteria bacterium]|nr:hypothetical protein [Candidatus Riflebacteria bacterium]